MVKGYKELIGDYFAEHSIVESNIKSFNNFMERRMQEIIDEANEIIPTIIPSEVQDFKIKLGKLKVEKPQLVEADGSKRDVYPMEARLRKLTYSAPVNLSVSTYIDGVERETFTVTIGKIPVMLKSKYCHLHKLDKDKLAEVYEDSNDPGGYFILNGNERVLIVVEDLASNKLFIDKAKTGPSKYTARLYSERGSYRIPHLIEQMKDGVIYFSFTRFKRIPAVAIIKALGLIKDQEISEAISKTKVYDDIFINLYECIELKTQDDALEFIAKKIGITQSREEKIERATEMIDKYLFPHLGVTKEDRLKKAYTLCKYIKRFLTVSKEGLTLSDKDHYMDKRLKLSGDLLADLFRVNLRTLIQDMLYNFQRLVKRGKFQSVRIIIRDQLLTSRIKSAMATGVWVGGRKGISQNIDRTNFSATISHLQRVVSLLSTTQENFDARALHSTHWGRLGPIETPEGTEIGLRKNLAILSRVSTRTKMNEEEIIKILEQEKLDKEAVEGKDVVLNGKFIGTIKDNNEFVKILREKRREGELPEQMSIRNNLGFETVILSSEAGRVLRPLIIVDNGVPRINNNHLIQIQQGNLNWRDLFEKGLIEYIDASEEENSLISLFEEELTAEHTHLEIDPISLFGAVTSLVPYGNHNQSSRLNRGSKTQKQALGIYSANYLCRLDTDVSILQYPQKPIVRSFVYDALDIYPAGQNLIVGIMTYEGYNMEDALVLNKGGVDRGVGRSFYFRPYSAIEMNYAGGLKDEIVIPEKDISGYKMEKLYSFLENDGIVYPEAEISEGGVLVGKVSPPKFLSEARDISIRTKKESSVTLRQEEKGTVESVFVTIDDEGNKIVQVKTRDLRIPELGDKFATSHGQKGVIGAIVSEEDMHSLFGESPFGKYTGKVTVTGEMTQEKCDSYCPLSTGKLSPSTKQCDCSPVEVVRIGRQYCTDIGNQKVCGELGRQTTANDGTEVTFRKEKVGGFLSKNLIEINFKESTDSLSYQ